MQYMPAELVDAAVLDMADVIRTQNAQIRMLRSIIVVLCVVVLVATVVIGLMAVKIDERATGATATPLPIKNLCGGGVGACEFNRARGDGAQALWTAWDHPRARRRAGKYQRNINTAVV